MRYSVDVPNFGEFAAPEVFAEVARRVEEAGWDGLLVWDHVVEHKHRRRDLADPWILVTAAALATRRIRLGTAITPVARRRPSKLAREVATLDRLTGGRIVLGSAWARPWRTRTPALATPPTPGCSPSVWTIPVMAGIEAGRPPEVRQVRELVLFLGGCRAEHGLADTRFDIVIGGRSPAGPAAGRDRVGPLADLGITWWDERMPWGDDLERTEPILRRIDQGPPRI